VISKYDIWTLYLWIDRFFGGFFFGGGGGPFFGGKKRGILVESLEGIMAAFLKACTMRSTRVCDTRRQDACSSYSVVIQYNRCLPIPMFPKPPPPQLDIPFGHGSSGNLAGFASSCYPMCHPEIFRFLMNRACSLSSLTSMITTFGMQLPGMA